LCLLAPRPARRLLLDKRLASNAKIITAVALTNQVFAIWQACVQCAAQRLFGDAHGDGGVTNKPFAKGRDAHFDFFGRYDFS
jgi:hypothetical protein